MQRFNSVSNIRKAENCHTAWDELHGSDERVRRCPHCGEKIYRVTGLDIGTVLSMVDGEDVTLYLRRDGTVKGNDRECRAPKLFPRLLRMCSALTI